MDGVATVGDFNKITANVTQLSVSVRDLSKYIEVIGTPKDSREMRIQAKTNREETQKIIIETRTLLGKTFNKEDKLKHDKLVKNFNDILAEYERLSKQSLIKEQEFINVMEKRRSTLKSGQNAPTREGIQMQEFDFTEVDELILQERNDEMKQIEQNLQELADCFVDISKEIQVQGEDLEKAEVNVSSAKVETSKGVEELKEANRLLTKRRICYLIIILVILIIILAIGLGVGLSKKSDKDENTSTTTTSTTTSFITTSN